MRTTAAEHFPTRGVYKQRLSFATELLLMCLVCTLLVWLAQPLALPGLAGCLGQRYDINIAPQNWLDLWTSTSALLSRVDEEPRAILLLRAASTWDSVKPMLSL